MDLQTRDRASAHVAPLPAGEPGVHLPGDGPGARTARRARLEKLLLASVAGYVALNIAHTSHVRGVSAVPPLFRVGIAALALFAVCGYGLTRLLLPEALRRHETLWVMPVGACAVALSMTVLGFAYVP